MIVCKTCGAVELEDCKDGCMWSAPRAAAYLGIDVQTLRHLPLPRFRFSKQTVRFQKRDLRLFKQRAVDGRLQKLVEEP